MELCRGNNVHRIEGKYIHQENGQFWLDGLCGFYFLSGWEPCRRDDAQWKNDFQPSSLTSTFPSRCSETTNWNVDRETGSLESTGSELDSGLNNGSGDSHCAAPKCLELEETANPEVHTSVSEMSNFDSTDSGPEPISCLGTSSIDVATSSEGETLPMTFFLVTRVRN